MKILFRLSSILVLFAALTTIMSCGGGGGNPPVVEPTKKEKVTAQLTAGTATWAPPASGGITLNGTTDVTADLFKDFSIKFTATTFTTTGTTPVWQRSDTWHFKDDNANVIIRGQDGKEISIVSISDTQLKLTLHWDKTTTAPAGGREQSIEGDYQFILNK